MSKITASFITGLSGVAPTFINGAVVTGVITATTFVGALTGTASTATAAATAYGLTGTPNITVGNITGTGATFTNLTVNGTQTIINTTSLEVADKNIGIGSTSSPTDALADGAGITIYGTTNKTLTWSNTTKNWTFVGGGVTVSDLSASGNLFISGIATIGTSLDLKGKNIGIGSTSSPTDALADGAGITIYGTTDKTLTYNNTKKGFETNVAWATTDTRFISVAEKLVRVDGNTVSLVYNTTGANIGFATNPSGNITLAVTGIPTSSDFDNHVITFSVFVNQTGTARSCTAVTLNGVTPTIKFAGGSLGAAISGVTTTSGFDIYSFTGINTVGSASTTANYAVLGVVNGGFR